MCQEKKYHYKKLISGSFSELKKISFTVNGLYEIDSKFAPGDILKVRTSSKYYIVLSFLLTTVDLYWR